MKPLKAYQTKKIPKKDGNEQARMLQAMGITAEELEEAQRESAKLRAEAKTRGTLQTDVNP